MLGSWYTPREIGKRAMIFWLAGTVGQLFSGFLQAAAYTNLHGVHGYTGCMCCVPTYHPSLGRAGKGEGGNANLSFMRWLAGRWLFLIDGIITLPLAVAGYLFFPNLPQGGKKTWWLTEEEHLLSVGRMQAIGRAGKQPWTRDKIRKILLSWHTYILRKIIFLSLTIPTPLPTSPTYS
jgi:ACS family pantothenate transporter-like MFS transporter